MNESYEFFVVFYGYRILIGQEILAWAIFSELHVVCCDVLHFLS